MGEIINTNLKPTNYSEFLTYANIKNPIKNIQ